MLEAGGACRGAYAASDYTHAGRPHVQGSAVRNFRAVQAAGRRDHIREGGMRDRNLDRLCPVCRKPCVLERVRDNLFRCSICRAAFYVIPGMQDAAVQDNAPRGGGALWR